MNRGYLAGIAVNVVVLGFVLSGPARADEVSPGLPFPASPGYPSASGASAPSTSRGTAPAVLAVDSRIELVQQPRPDPSWVLPELAGLLPQAWMGRVSRLGLTLEQDLLPGVRGVIAARAVQDLEEPLLNPDWHDTARNRLEALRRGGSDLRPLYLPELHRAMIVWRDVERGGEISVGQMVVPMDFEDAWAAHPSPALAPRFTPLTTWLSGRSTSLYEPSIGSRFRDVGARMAVDTGPFPWSIGLFNGSGPNRLDDGPEKHVFARLDWRARPTDRIGASLFWGTETLHPSGFDVPGVRLDRKRWNVHAEFETGGLTWRGVWGRDDRGDGQALREGGCFEVAQPAGDGGRWYARGSWFTDPKAMSDVDYRTREALVGFSRAWTPGWTWRSEACYRWEDAGTTHTEDLRWLSALDLRWTIEP
ncbi:MAG: hypothetical protein VKP72_05810 [bacterium]|nr:hypothetical protein [bacterium]